MFFVLQFNFIHLSQHIALTILHLIGQFFLHWLVLSLPATAQTTAPAEFHFFETQQLEQSAALPLWKESTSSFWSHLSESLEESSAENDNEDGNALANQKFLQEAASHTGAAKKWNKAFSHANVPLYLRYCSLKIHLV